MLSGTYFGFLVSGNYKTFGKKYIKDDAYLTLIGAVGAMGNGLSRFAWATLLDKFDFKCLYTALLIINAFLALTIYYAAQIPQLYMFYVFMAYVCYGGHLGMFPAVTSQIFGVRNGSQIYGILFLAFASANAIQFLVVKTLKHNYGFQPIFWLGVVFNGLAIFVVNSF